MGENSYTSVARRADTTNQDNKYRTLVEKLIHFEANDWPVLGTPEKTTLGRILASTSSTTGWEWKEVQCCSPNKTHVGFATPARTTKSVKSRTKQLLHVTNPSTEKH